MVLLLVTPCDQGQRADSTTRTYPIRTGSQLTSISRGTRGDGPVAASSFAPPDGPVSPAQPDTADTTDAACASPPSGASVTVMPVRLVLSAFAPVGWIEHAVLS